MRKSATQSDQDKAVDAVGLLNDLVGDFVSGVRILEEYDVHYQRNTISATLMTTVYRMCLFHLIISLCKFNEFYQHYRKIIPTAHREVCAKLAQTIQKKGIIDIRNRYVGHIWDSIKKRPLLNSEITQRLERVLGSEHIRFFVWINNPKDNTYPNTVVSIAETIRDALITEYSITSSELFNMKDGEK